MDRDGDWIIPGRKKSISTHQWTLESGRRKPDTAYTSNELLTCHVVRIDKNHALQHCLETIRFYQGKKKKKTSLERNGNEENDPPDVESVYDLLVQSRAIYYKT